MKLRVRSELVYAFEQPTDVLYKVLVARWPGQPVLEETLSVDPPFSFREDMDSDSGARVLRVRLNGEVSLTYEAVVSNGRLTELHDGLRQRDWGDLPVETLPYLLPSRFCPTDQFGSLVETEFAGLEGGARVRAMVEWIRNHISYTPGASGPSTTAADTFIERAGVCRDFTHLGVTLCRAAGIPARAVSAYAHLLDPPDFHAVMEVWLGHGWWLIDPTGLAPVDGLVRIAAGRDAADIAFLTTNGGCRMKHQKVSVEEA